MAVTNIISAGTTATSSSNITIASGATATIAARGTPSGTEAFRVVIERQMTNSAWARIGLLHPGCKQLTLYGEGTYRATRRAAGGCLVDLAK